VVVSTQGLQKSFGDRPVLRDLSLQIAQGEIYGLIGPSGSGKSTAIHLLCGHLQPSAGTVSVLGSAPSAFDRETRRSIGYMPQNFILNLDLTVKQNLSFVAGLYGLWWWPARRRVREVLQLVELWRARRQKARKISGGMQRRLALAAALVHKPQLLFADEPTANLDPILRTKLWEHFRAMSEEGRTLLITTQYIDEAENCDRVGLMHDGALIAEGRPEEVRRSAFGGDIVTVALEEPSPLHVDVALRAPGVLEAEASRDGSLRLIVEDAETTVPSLLQELQDRGATVSSVAQYRPSFDEVFVRLIQQYEGRQLAMGGLRRIVVVEG
jgi:ABC-2 type transport system ATP-binding protein